MNKILLRPMNLKKITLFAFLALFIQLGTAQAQTACLKGRVADALNNEGISYATITIQGSTAGAYSDSAGYYTICNLNPGNYNIECTVVGYNKKVEYEIEVINNMPAVVNFQLDKTSTVLKEAKISAADKFYRMEESPLSVRNIGVNEIQRNPGSNRDISKVIQNLPGVAATVSYRNDLLVRGGGPSENRFYLDGIEIPNINHFATQGSTGGPVGLLNVDFIREAEFYTGAFPANRGNCMSSILDLKNKDGRSDHWGGTLTTGYTASGLSLEGPVGKHTTVLLSARQSYLQVLFKQIGLPFLPTFTDFEVKVHIKPNKKNDITILGLNALDQFAFNPDAVTKAKDSTRKAYAQYILGYLPGNEQQNNTIGVNWRHFRKNGYTTTVISRNALDNYAYKYTNNDESNAANLIYKYRSYESEIKARIESTGNKGGYKFNYGAGAEHAYYTNATFNRISTPYGIDTIDYNSKLSFQKFNLFGQLTHGYFGDLLKLSFGLRTDFNNYSNLMLNPLKQLSPRFSASYQLNENSHLNFNTGVYYQLPGYTVLGYRSPSGNLVNMGNKVTYIQCKQRVLGADHFTQFNAKFAVEGFYKLYAHYPFSVTEKVSLGNLGGDFGVLGNEAITSTNKGRAYGAELSYQQKLYKGFYGIFTYTFVRSEFQDNNNKYVSASWDYRHIINATVGKKFKHNWEVGAKVRYQGGQPYTPYDEKRSLAIPVWNVTGQGLLDFSRLNTMRSQDLFNLDFRMDKKWLFKKWAVIFYADVQNLLDTKTVQQSFLSVERDSNGAPMVDPANPGYYLKKEIVNTNGVRTPNLGLIIEL